MGVKSDGCEGEGVGVGVSEGVRGGGVREGVRV